MMKAPRQAVLGLALSGVATTAASAVDLSGVPSGVYELDPTHAYLTFTYDHLGFSEPRIAFDDFTIDLNLDAEDPTRSTVEVTIAADSVVAGSETWREGLTGDEFFDVSNYPDITFRSTNVAAGEEGRLVVDGELTIKDRSAPVTLDVTINQAMPNPRSGEPTVGLAAAAQLMRSDYGFDVGVPLVSDEIELEVAAELIKVQ